MRHVTAPRKAVHVGSDWCHLDGESLDNLASDAPCDCSLQDCPLGFIESLFDWFGRFGFVS